MFHLKYYRQNKKHRKPLRCFLFCLAGDERVELPSAVLECVTPYVLTCCKMLKPLVLKDMSILVYINLSCYLSTFRIVSRQIVDNLLRHSFKPVSYTHLRAHETR